MKLDTAIAVGEADRQNVEMSSATRYSSHCSSHCNRYSAIAVSMKMFAGSSSNQFDFRQISFGKVRKAFQIPRFRLPTCELVNAEIDNFQLSIWHCQLFNRMRANWESLLDPPFYAGRRGSNDDTVSNSIKFSTWASGCELKVMSSRFWA